MPKKEYHKTGALNSNSFLDPKKLFELLKKITKNYCFRGWIPQLWSHSLINYFENSNQ